MDATVPFQCPYCGRTERHPAGRKLPEMCGQCAFERESGIETNKPGAAGPARPVPKGFVKKGPPPLVVPTEPVATSIPGQEDNSLKRYLDRQRWERQKKWGVTVVLAFAAAVVVGWNWPEISRIAVEGAGRGQVKVGLNPQLANAVGLNADRNAVSRWLQENWDSTDWEEVKWWPAVDLTRKPGREKFQNCPDRICRIRIRTKNVFSRLNDLTFEILPNGKAKRIDSPWADTYCHFAGMAEIQE